MFDSGESDCFFDGLDLAKDGMLKAVRAMCDARHIEDVGRVAGEFGRLIDVLGHLIGAGLAARNGDTETANLEATAALDELRHSDETRQVSDSPALMLAADPRRLSGKELEDRRQFWTMLRGGLSSDAERLAQRYGLRTERQRVQNGGAGAREGEERESPSWAGLLDWFYFSFHLSASVEDALVGKRREAKEELKEAQDLAVGNLGGKPLEYAQCARRVADRILPRQHVFRLAGAAVLTLAVVGAILGALSTGGGSQSDASNQQNTTIPSTAPSPTSTTAPSNSTNSSVPQCEPATLELTPEPSSLAFVKPGETRTVTMTASLQAAGTCRDRQVSVDITSVTSSDPSSFEIGAAGCAGMTLTPSLSCTQTVTFQPRGSGTSATLVFTDTASNSPQSVTLSGTTVGRGTNLSPAPPNQIPQKSSGLTIQSSVPPPGRGPA